MGHGQPTAKTDENGAYSFSHLRPNTYELTASAEGFVTDDYSRDGSLEGKFVILKDGDTFGDMDIRLATAGAISGTVSDEHNQPVSGVEVSAVRLLYSPGGTKIPRQVQGARTDGHGAFRLARLAPGFYYVCVNRPDGVETAGLPPGFNYRETCYGGATSPERARRVQVIAGEETRDIQISTGLERRYNITGKVTGPGQESAPPRYRYSINIEGRGGQYTMEDDGSFVIPDIPPGDYTLEGMAWDKNSRYAGLGTATVHVVGADVQVNVRASGLARVSGRAVLQSSGAVSVAGKRLLISSQVGGSSSVFDADGHFDIVNVLPGHYTFALADPERSVYLKQVRCSGREYTTQPLEVEAGQLLADCEVTLADDAGAVKGAVGDGGAPARGLTVVLIPEAVELRKLARYVLAGKTDGDGRFVIPGVIPGDYFVFALPETEDHPYFATDFADRNRPAAARVVVRPGETQVVALEPLKELK
jgi:hypothetical protein